MRKTGCHQESPPIRGVPYAENGPSTAAVRFSLGGSFTSVRSLYMDCNPLCKTPLPLKTCQGSQKNKKSSFILMFLHISNVLSRRRLHAADERLKRTVSQTFQNTNPSPSQVFCLLVRTAHWSRACKIVSDDREVLTGESMSARLFLNDRRG